MDDAVKRYFRQAMKKSRDKKRGEVGRSPLTELENLQVLCAWHCGEVTIAQAAEFIGVAVEEIPDLWQEAVKAGKKKV